MWNRLFSSADFLQQGLSANWLRSTVIRNNIANVETPGFKSSDVHFETLLANSLTQPFFEGKTTRERHIPIGGLRFTDVQPRIVQNRELSMRMDENNVDIEAENVKLAQTQIQYNTLMYKLNSELSRIRMAINEGR